MSPGCPICKAENYTIIFKHLQENDDIAIVKCDHCFHIYTLLIDQPDRDKLYNDKVYKVVENRNTIFDKLLGWEYGRVIKRINSFKPSKGALLDFGCGKGKFGSIAKNNGWQVQCVETAIERATYAQNVYSLEVSTDLYAAGRIFNNDFDVITLFHVLEHLPCPKTLLSELIKHNLAKKGLLVLEVPNIRSLQARIAGSKWIHLDPSHHINHFIPEEIDQIGEELSLKILRTRFFSFHLGVLGMSDSFLKLFGYRKNMIYELKNKNIALMTAIFILLPFAFILESFAAAIGRGGIVRKYFIAQH